jgi:hypothetical protein
MVNKPTDNADLSAKVMRELSLKVQSEKLLAEHRLHEDQLHLILARIRLRANDGETKLKVYDKLFSDVESTLISMGYTIKTNIVDLDENNHANLTIFW